MAAAVLAAARLFRPGPPPAFAVASAVPLGFAAGYLGVLGWPPVPPRVAEHALPWIALAGGALGTAFPALARRGFARRVTFAALAVAVLWLLQRGSASSTWPGAWAALAPLLLVIGVGAHYWLLDEATRRLPGATFVFPYALAAAAAAPLLFFAGASSFAHLGAALAAAVGGFGLAGLRFGPCFWRPLAAPLALLLPALLFTGFLRTYGFCTPAALLLLVAPAAALAGDLPGVRNAPGWFRFAVRLAAVGLIAGGAVLLAWSASRSTSGGY